MIKVWVESRSPALPLVYKIFLNQRYICYLRFQLSEKWCVFTPKEEISTMPARIPERSNGHHYNEENFGSVEIWGDIAIATNFELTKWESLKDKMKKIVSKFLRNKCQFLIF